MKILHVISGLTRGGAETMLWRLLGNLDKSEFQSMVICLTAEGPIGDQIRELGIPVSAMNMRKRFPNPLSIVQLAGLIRDFRPDCVHTWLYHADLLGGLATRLAGKIPLVWSLHSGADELNELTRTTGCIVRACASLSRILPDVIVSCSTRAQDIHRRRGYDDRKMIMIPNGFDLSEYTPDLQARESIRAEVGIPRDAVVIGLVARFHPVKNHRGFIKAASLVARARPNVRFVLCGDGITASNMELATWLQEESLRDCTHLLGSRGDVKRVTASLDIACLASLSEAFPLVVGEAMACGVPCVVTDVGDARAMLGDAGIVVPSGNPEAFAEAIVRLIDSGPSRRAALGALGRERVKREFDVRVVTGRYSELYRSLSKQGAIKSPNVRGVDNAVCLT